MKIIVLSVSLLIAGMALPFLMVMRLLEPSFALSFFAYATSLVGLALGSTVVVQQASLRWRGRH